MERIQPKVSYWLLLLVVVEQNVPNTAAIFWPIARKSVLKSLRVNILTSDPNKDLGNLNFFTFRQFSWGTNIYTILYLVYLDIIHRPI
jgi:hypothetical protein